MALRVLRPQSREEALEHIKDTGADARSYPYLVPKTITLCVEIKDVSARDANIIKQEALSKGGDASISISAYSLKGTSKVLLIGSIKTLEEVAEKLNVQPIKNLRALSGEIKRSIENYLSVPTFKVGDSCFEQTAVMGILNVTPDSFYDGGKYSTLELIAERAEQIEREGGDIIDLGGQSTKPGYVPVSLEEEKRRVIPALRAIMESTDVRLPISIDTSKPEVAEEALKLGASIINDQEGGDEKIAQLAVDYNASLILMHNRKVDRMEMMFDILEYLEEKINLAEKKGVEADRISIDPGIVVSNESTMVALGNIASPSTLLAVFGLCTMALLSALNVKGALLFGILATTLLGWVFGIPARPESIGDIIALPDFSALSSTFVKMDFAGALELGLVWVVITFTFVDMFDTLGTVTGLATKLDIIDERGSFRGAKKVFITDSIGTIIGSMLGTSTVTTYVESASGVAEGGRTGLTAIVTGIAFLLTLFFVPFAKLVPNAATAPALIMVGLFMMEPVLKIDLKDITNALPAFLTMIAMPLTYSISNGLMLGIISYTVLKVLTKRWSEISITMIILSAIFIVYLLV